MATELPNQTEDTSRDIFKEILKRKEDDDAFIVADVGDVIRKYQEWIKAMPRVTPFYAMKCNNDPVLLQLLENLGVGFDCASKGEINDILRTGAHPSRIIYANTIKSPSFIQHAASVGVDLMTFDCESELAKIKERYPTARLLIRIAVDQSGSKMPIAEKFACEMKEVPNLLKTAKNLQLNVVGVSFHVGSRCMNVGSFTKAIGDAKEVFDLAKSNGLYDMDLLDIGGGFPEDKSPSPLFKEISKAVNDILDIYFPTTSGVKIMAEPGRYFAGSAYTLYTNVIGKREVDSTDGNGRLCMYYVNEGIHGIFDLRDLLYYAEYEPIMMKNVPGQPMKHSMIWGPTCDPEDKLTKGRLLPDLDIGDWIAYKDIGSYTISTTSTFNGFPKTPIWYYISADDMQIFKNLTETAADGLIKDDARQLKHERFLNGYIMTL